MKRTTKIVFGLMLSLTVTSCGSKQPQAKDPDTEPVVEYTTSESGDNIRRYECVNINGDIAYRGHNYRYTIIGEPCDSLPMVSYYNSTYADNLFTLTILRDGEPFVSKEIGKTTLNRFLTSEFQQKGILDGIIYDNRQEGLRFRVSVSFPESDVHTPLLLIVGNDGSIRFEHDIEAEQEE